MTDNVLGLCDELDAALDGFEAQVLPIAPQPAHRLSHAADAIGKVVNQAESEADRLDGELAFEKERHALRVADLTEQRRQCISIISRCAPAVEGMVEDFHSDKPVNVVAIASKRKRASKPAPILQAAE